MTVEKKFRLQGLKVLVVGLQRSGIGAALILKRLGANVRATDLKSIKELGEGVAGLIREGIDIKDGGHEERDFLESDLIVISPGVRTDMHLLKKAKDAGVEVIGELEFAFRTVRSGLTPLKRDIPFYAVTGTNGKSTVTTLLGLILNNHGIRTSVCGNIGKAITAEILDMMEGRVEYPDAFVVEVSSFQLETIKDFRPSIATILNITPDHLDRYRSMDEYIEAKARIGLNMKRDDFIILNADDPVVMKCRQMTDSEILYFSRKVPVEGIYLEKGGLKIKFKDREVEIDIKDMKIKGVHNTENAMASTLMAFLAGASRESIEKTLREFRGLEHRTEFVEEIDGVLYINDSKGTNVGALMKSLEGFSNIVLIAGGRDKKGDFSVLRPLIKERVKAMVLIGEAKEKIRESLGDLTLTVFASDMKDAVIRAKELARKGDVVLLSPGCASFDMFRDFEERGRIFKEIVRELKGGIRKD
ncbi:MAG: UDP-N-acetylmuramoyl-L-alanine--D-glutamate ligase [Thermodesulfovibrionales bacterium]|nr:UDP-N-acetylmuramoyl-L-alanine--D-glutamate ligase [Thermodesulfovibrionales bacterium]